MTAVVLIGLLHVTCAWIVARRLIPCSRPADLPVVAGLVASGTFYGVPVALGWATGLMNLGIVAAGAATALGLAAYAWLRGAAPVLPSMRAVWREWRWYERVLLAGLAVACLFVLSVGSVFPIRFADARDYHSIAAMRWAESGEFSLESYGDPERIYMVSPGEVFPNAKAVFPYIVLRTTGAVEGTAATQWPFLVLLIAVLHSIARRAGLPRWASIAGMGFVLGMPEFMLNALEAYADIVYCAGLMAVAWCSLRGVQDGVRRADLVVAALAYALLVSSKPFGILAAALQGVFFLGVCAACSGRAGWLARVREAALGLALIIAACLAVAGPWYINGIRKYGNPVYPVKVSLGPLQLPGRTDPEVGIKQAEGKLGAEGLGALWVMLHERYRLGTLSAWDAGYGAHVAVVGFPVLIAAAIGILGHGGRRRWWPILAVFLLMWPASPAIVIPRYNMWLMCFAGLGFAWIVAGAALFWRALLLAVFAILCGYNIMRALPSMPWRYYQQELHAYWLVSGDRNSMQFEAWPDEVRAQDIWREVVGVKPGARLAFSQQREVFAWPMRPRSNAGTVVAAPYMGAFGSQDEWVAALRATGATHFYTFVGDPALEAALARPADFALVFRRFDSGFESPFGPDPRPEDALFEILRPGTERES